MQQESNKEEDKGERLPKLMHAASLPRLTCEYNTGDGLHANGGGSRFSASQVVYNANRRSRSALPMTDTELNVIAALASMGLSNTPNTG